MGKQAVKNRTKRATRKKFSAAYQRKIAERIAQLDEIAASNPKAERIVALLKSWLADESGYDERVWPELKRGLEENHTSSRQLFCE